MLRRDASRAAVVSFLVLVPAAAWLGVAPAVETRGQDAAAADPPRQAEPVRLRAALLEVRTEADSLPLLDAADLAQAEGIDGCLDKLAAHGAARVVYLIDQSVDLNGGSQAQVMTRTPLVTASRLAEGGGAAVNTISYQDLGASVTISEAPAEPRGRAATISLEVTMPAATKVELGRGATALAIDTFRNSRLALPARGKPTVVVAGSAAGDDAAERRPSSRVYVWRVVVGE